MRAMKIFSGVLLVLGVMILAFMITEAFIDVHFKVQYEVLWARRGVLAIAISLGSGMITAAILIRRNSN
jgi:hypothetical protein